MQWTSRGAGRSGGALALRRLSCSIDEADAVGLGDDGALAALGARGRPVAALVLRHHKRLDGSSYHGYTEANLSPQPDSRRRRGLTDRDRGAAAPTRSSVEINTATGAASAIRWRR